MRAAFDTSGYVTASEYLAHPASTAAGELVRGQVRVMSLAGGMHGVIVGRVFALLHAFVDANRLGVCFADNTGFELAGPADTVRSPDAAFVSSARLPRGGIGAGWVTATPDLVVEVLSPNESMTELEAKLADYRVAGARTFWIIDPASRSVIVRDGDAPELRLRESNLLRGAGALRGFTLDIARLFEGLAA